jgi:hypothetical protein
VSKFGNIFLSWRKGVGFPRHIVGVIKRNASEGVTFQYFPYQKLRGAQKDAKLTKIEKEKLTREEEILNLAKNDGFDKYTEFQDLEKVYTDGVLEVFKQRLFKSERSDYKDFLAFWEIDKKYKDDTLHLLAHTHGMVPTDNFEFLADFHLTKDLKFVSEIAGLSYFKPKSSLVGVNDELIWEAKETSEDKFQVDVFSKDGTQLGWIKKVHSKIFHKKGANSLKVKVKALDKNGVLKRVFIQIYV